MGILNKSVNPNKPKSEDIYFVDQDSDMGNKVIVRDHELLFAFSNQNETDLDETNDANNWNVGWLGSFVSKIKIASYAQQNNCDNMELRIRQSGQSFDANIGIISIC